MLHDGLQQLEHVPSRAGGWCICIRPSRPWNTCNDDADVSFGTSVSKRLNFAASDSSSPGWATRRGITVTCCELELEGGRPELCDSESLIVTDKRQSQRWSTKNSYWDTGATSSCGTASAGVEATLPVATLATLATLALLATLATPEVFVLPVLLRISVTKSKRWSLRFYSLS